MRTKMAQITSKRANNTAEDGFTREELRESLRSQNPLRRAINYSNEALFLLEYTWKYAVNSGLVRTFNETMESIAEFYTNLAHNGKGPIDITSGQVVVMVKIVENGHTKYMNKSNRFPHEFIKNKGIAQFLVFRQIISSNDARDWITIPFMIGSKWCATYGMNPLQLHNNGENAVDYRASFLIEGAYKYFLAHEKIAHNAITTIYDELLRNFVTSLKIQDELNNSVEAQLFKGRKIRGQRKEEENTYFLKTTCFKEPFETNKIFKQIYLLLEELSERDQGLEVPLTYDDFMEEIILIVAGQDLRHFVLYDYTEEDSNPILPEITTSMDEALTALYRKEERKNMYIRLNPDLIDLDRHYAKMVINSIFPSVSSTRNQYDIYRGKAMLLMRMIITNVLTEQKILPPTDRNNVGYKSYMTAAELFRRDLTRDGASILKKPGVHYKPIATTAKGEADVFEFMESPNVHTVFSQLTTLSTPRSVHSKTAEIRGVNASHTGYVCPYESPSSEMIGLKTHMAYTASFSVPKKVHEIQNLVKNVVDSQEAYSKDKLLSINSVPFMLIDTNIFDKIRKIIKRDYRLMDTAIVEEIYKTGKEIHIASYNILCDGGRIYRPLYNSIELITRGLVEDDAINEYIGTKSLEQMVSEGVIEMVFSIEMEFYVIAESRSKLNIQPVPKFCEIDPVALYGIVASCAPMGNHNPGNRMHHEASMAKSGITAVSTNPKILVETSAKLLHSAEPAAVTTKNGSYLSRYIKDGVNAIMSIAIQEENAEDAFLVNQAFANRIITERVITISVSIGQEDYPGIPNENNYHMELYHDIDTRTGLPRVGSYRRAGDCIFAKYQIENVELQAGNGESETQEQIVNKSEFIDTGKDGYVQKYKEVVVDRTRTYHITIASIKTLETGDKLASRYSQKGVIGAIKTASQMPIVIQGKNKGLIPHVIFSSMSLSSRATPGLVLELLLGNYAVATGNVIDATSFTMSKERLEYYNAELVRLGYPPWGIELYEDPMTQSRFYMMTGIVHLRVLKQVAVEKQKACGFINQTIDKITRQPSKAGANGPVKLGHMDYGVLMAHSASHMITTMFKNQSDKVLIDLCSSCGHLCDRCNKDPETARDRHASRYCAKCSEPTITTACVPYSIVAIHNSLISAGIKLSLFTSEGEFNSI
jgi:DNA-directed RNA polymerase beta subunit